MKGELVFIFMKKRDVALELVEDSITQVTEEMKSVLSDSDEFAKMNDQLSKLIETRSKLKVSGRISPETWATIIANLAGILLILNYERANIIVSKAFGHITKLRL